VKIKILSTCFILILFGLISTSAVPAVTDGQIILAEIQNRYENTNDLEASFIQEYIGKVMRQSQRSEGKVYFKKRGMMKWDYRIPNQKLISDGHTLWYYQPEENQVLVYNVSKVIKEFGFLAGEGDLRGDFRLLNINESISQKEDHIVLELVPKEPHSALAKFSLTVDKKTYFVIQTDVFDGLGNVTRTRFIDIKTNIDLPNAFFQFKIPPGTEVFKMRDSYPPSPGGKGSQKK
jgi:outer membrane lipoprotein carrier protein